jgi:hypothetical protein
MVKSKASAARRKTMGSTPWDGVVPRPVVGGKGEQKEQEEKREKKVRLTVHIWPETLERVRRAVYWTPGETMSGFVERVLNQAVDASEKQRGEPFPERTGPLKMGRPIR